MSSGIKQCRGVGDVLINYPKQLLWKVRQGVCRPTSPFPRNQPPAAIPPVLKGKAIEFLRLLGARLVFQDLWGLLGIGGLT